MRPKALRQRECDRLAEAGEGILPLPKQPQQYCERATLDKQLAQDAGARPNRLGANSRLAFYSLLPTPNGPYVTLVLLQEGSRAAFLSGSSASSAPEVAWDGWGSGLLARPAWPFEGRRTPV